MFLQLESEQNGERQWLNLGGNNSCDDGGDVGSVVDDIGGVGDVGDIGGGVGDVSGDFDGDVGDHQSPAELERLHPPVPVQTVLLPLVGSMEVDMMWQRSSLKNKHGAVVWLKVVKK